MKRNCIIPQPHLDITKPAGFFLEPAIFGVNDGIVSILALIAGFIAATVETKLIIIGGLVEIFSGAISMAIGTYISTKSKLEFYENEIRQSQCNITTNPTLEKKHLIALYREKGFKGKELKHIVAKIMSNKKVWKQVVVQEELGLTEYRVSKPFIAGLVMFFSFVFASFIPLLPFFFHQGTPAFHISAFSGLLVLFFVGMARTYFTGKHPIRSGIEMVLIGGIATLIAYSIGTFVGNLF